MKIERVYHPYWLWEDYLNGMYGKPIFSRIDTGETEEERLLKVGECLGNEKVCREYMQYVIDNWKYACEYRLTNKSINRIAWLGQSAMNVYAGLKESETKKGWWLMSQEQRDKADEIAKELIKEWEERWIESI